MFGLCEERVAIDGIYTSKLNSFYHLSIVAYSLCVCVCVCVGVGVCVCVGVCCVCSVGVWVLCV